MLIVTKCNRCGKVNQTVDKQCKNAAFHSRAERNTQRSNTDNFALMTLDFPNVNELRNLLGSVQLLNNLKLSLIKLFMMLPNLPGRGSQVVNNTYIIRFDKDYTFNSSVNTAIIDCN